MARKKPRKARQRSRPRGGKSRRKPPARKPAKRPTRKPARKPPVKAKPKPRPKPKPKPPLPPPAPPKPKPRVYPRLLPPITTRERTIWRDKKGRITKPKARGAVAHVYVDQVDPTGKVIRTLEHRSPSVVTKTILPFTFQSPLRGVRQGRIDEALVDSSVTGVIRKAKLVEVTVKGRDGRGKLVRFKLIIDLESVKQKRYLENVITYRVRQELRDRGLRTTYTLSLYKEARARGLRPDIDTGEVQTWDDWRSLDQIRDMEMIVTMYL